MRFLIVYDVAHAKQRARIARLLEGHGVRVQKSVFEADLSASELRHLVRHLRQLVEDADDDACSVRLYTLCNTCAPRTLVLGDGPPIHQEPAFYLA